MMAATLRGRCSLRTVRCAKEFYPHCSVRLSVLDVTAVPEERWVIKIAVPDDHGQEEGNCTPAQEQHEALSGRRQFISQQRT